MLFRWLKKRMRKRKVEKLLNELFESIDLKSQLKEVIMSSSYTDENGITFDNFESYYKYGDLFLQMDTEAQEEAPDSEDHQGSE